MTQEYFILLLELLALVALFYSVLLCSFVFHCASFIVRNKNTIFKQSPYWDIENQVIKLNESEESSNDIELEDINSCESSIYYVKNNQKID